MVRLYDAVKLKLGDKFGPVTYQTMREDKPRAVGIYLYEGQADRVDMSGDYVYEVIKVHIQVNADQTEDGILEALNCLREAVRRLETERSDVPGVVFLYVQHSGPKAIPIGKNGYNIPVCVSNIEIKYKLR